MKSYECKYHEWDKWTHYGMPMPFGVCRLTGKDCLGWCEDAEPKTVEPAPAEIQEQAAPAEAKQARLIRWIDAARAFCELCPAACDHVDAQDCPEVEAALEFTPVVDAVPVTRCGACKHSKKLYGSELFFCERNAGMFGEDEFCSRGEAEDDPA